MYLRRVEPAERSVDGSERGAIGGEVVTTVYIDPGDERIYVPAQAELRRNMLRLRRRWKIHALDEAILASDFTEIIDKTVCRRYYREAAEACREILTFSGKPLGRMWLTVLYFIRGIRRFIRRTKYGEYLSDHP